MYLAVEDLCHCWYTAVVVVLSLSQLADARSKASREWDRGDLLTHLVGHQKDFSCLVRDRPTSTTTRESSSNAVLVDPAFGHLDEAEPRT